MQVNGIKWVLSGRGIIAVYGPCKRKGHVGSRIHGPSTSVYTAREQVTRVHTHYTAMYTARTGSLHGSYTSVYGPSTAV